MWFLPVVLFMSLNTKVNERARIKTVDYLWNLVVSTTSSSSNNLRQTRPVAATGCCTWVTRNFRPFFSTKMFHFIIIFLIEESLSSHAVTTQLGWGQVWKSHPTHCWFTCVPWFIVLLHHPLSSKLRVQACCSYILLYFFSTKKLKKKNQT